MQTRSALDLRDLTALNLVNGVLYNDRYYGKLNDRLAVCVYTVGRQETYFAQLFPLPAPDAAMHACFVDFALCLTKNGDETTKALRGQYRYITAAADVLTLKCLIHEAEDHFWRKENELDDCKADAGAGKGVE